MPYRVYCLFALFANYCRCVVALTLAMTATHEVTRSQEGWWLLWALKPFLMSFSFILNSILYFVRGFCFCLDVRGRNILHLIRFGFKVYSKLKPAQVYIILVVSYGETRVDCSSLLESLWNPYDEDLPRLRTTPSTIIVCWLRSVGG